MPSEIVNNRLSPTTGTYSWRPITRRDGQLEARNAQLERKYQQISALYHTFREVYKRFEQFPDPVVVIDSTGGVHFNEVAGNLQKQLLSIGETLLDNSQNVVSVGTRIYEKKGRISPDGGSVFAFDDITEQKRQIARFESVIQSTSQGFWLLGIDRKFTYVNNALCTLLGYSREEVMEMDPIDLVDIDSQHILLDQISHIEDTEHRRYELSFQAKDGQKVPVLIQATTLNTEQGSEACAFITDLTKQKAKEKQLRLFENIIHTVRGAIVCATPEGIIEWINPYFTHLTGFSMEEACGKTPALLKSGMQDANFYREMWGDLLSVGEWRGDIVNRKKDGTLYVARQNIVAIHDERGQIVRFVSIQTEKEGKDRLTGLSDRLSFETFLENKWAESLREKTPLSLLMFDIDHFKRINDTYGHDVGDTVLQEFSTLLQKPLRGGDLFARWGGEEFILLLPNTNLRGAHEVAEKLRTLVEEHEILVGEIKIKITTSIGVAERIPQMSHQSMLIKKADTALYQAKRGGLDGTEGRNRVVSLS